MPVFIRLAHESDLEPLCDLIHAFHEFHVAWLPLRLASLGDLKSFDSRELVSELAKIIEDSEAAVFVAEEDRQLVGFAEVYFRQDEPNPAAVGHKYGFLQSLMVQEKVRSKGIGKQLLQAVEQWAWAKGAEEIRLEIWEFSAGPSLFYEKSGYETLKQILVKTI